MMKRLLVAMLVVVSALSLRAEIVEQVLVKVNGEIFTKTDLEQRQVQVLRQRNRSISVDDLKSDESLRQALDEVTPQLLVDALDEMLVLQQGRDRGYRMGDEQFKGILERIRKENKLEDEETFQAALKQEGVTLDELRKQFERQMIVSRIQQDAVGKVGVSEEEERAYYAAHTTEFTTPASVTLRELLVEVPSQGAGVGAMFNVARDEEAQKKAEAVRARVAAGEDFAAVVSTESDAASKANGGLIGPINLDDLAPDIRALVEPLTPGGMTTAVRTARGYQVFKLETITPATVLPFEKAREQIANKVYVEKRTLAFRGYMEKLRAQAIIEWKNEEVRKAYEKGLAVQAERRPS